MWSAKTDGMTLYGHVVCINVYAWPMYITEMERKSERGFWDAYRTNTHIETQHMQAPEIRRRPLACVCCMRQRRMEKPMIRQKPC